MKMNLKKAMAILLGLPYNEEETKHKLNSSPFFLDFVEFQEVPVDSGFTNSVDELIQHENIILKEKKFKWQERAEKIKEKELAKNKKQSEIK